MVKVQKPQPKSLNKTVKIEGVSKEKLKANKEKKQAKSSVALAAASADVSQIKKVKNVSKKSDIKSAVVEKKKVKDVSKAKTDAAEKKTKTSKKALVLAPPESPAAAAPKAKGGKRKLVEAAPKAPVTAEPKAKGGKKQLIEAAPASPAEAAPKGKGNKKKVPAAVPASPVAPAPKPKGGKNKLVLAAPASPTLVAPKAKGGKKAVAVPDSEPVSAPKTSKAKKETSVAGKKKGKDTVKVTAPAKQVVEKHLIKPAKKDKQPAIISKPAGKIAKKNAKPQLVKEVKKAAKNIKPVSKNVANKGKAKGKPTGGKKQKAKSTKKPKKVIELNYELKPFDEDQFFEIVSEPKVRKICDALKAQVTEEVKKQKATSIFSDYRYMLQVCCYKIPSCPKRLVKLMLQNSLVGANDDVAIIVPDLQRGARFDYEPTVQHYEDLFREAGVEQKLSVVPFNRLRNDMGTFEAKRKFLNSHDYFLCDGRISGQANAFLGQGTQKPRNVLHAVRLNKEDQLAKEISKSLCRTAYRQLCKGDLTAIPVGNHEHSGQQLAENIVTVIKQLQQQYPGGLANIRSMYLKIDIVGTSALPLYVSLCSPPADTPYVVGPREQRMLKLKKQANEVLSKFALTKDVAFIKLTDEQVKNKAEVRAKRLALKEAESSNDNDGQEAAVPAKKARKEPAVKAVQAEDDDVEEEDEDVEQNEEFDDENQEDDDDEDDEDDDDDEDEDDDDEEE